MASSEHIERCARVAHEAARALYAVDGRLAPPAWDNADETHREDARDGVRGCLAGLTPEDGTRVENRLVAAVVHALAQ